jgi:glycosyltransferase involved in cell wall biosynthesis
MKIALNAASLLSPLTGIGQYTYHLAKGLKAYQNLDIDLDMFYANGWSKEVRDRPIHRIRTIKFLLRAFIPKTYEVSRHIQQFHFNERSFQKVGGIYHEPNFLAFKYAGPMVLTVHDLSWIRYPEMHPKERVNAMHKFFEPSLSRANLILTVSDFVKQELIDVFSVAPERILTVYNGVESEMQPKDAVQTLPVLSHHNLKDKQYILAVGTLEPRKNLRVALQAYMGLSAQVRKHYPLVIVGMKGWNNDALEQQVRPLIAAGEVRLLGYLPREDLIDIVAGATMLIYPSVYEGFGLPVLEAMACAVPVITSNVSSLPEVIGDTGILINPHDVDELRLGIQSLIEDAALNSKLSQQGFERSKRFSWARCVHETVGAYQTVQSKL